MDENKLKKTMNYQKLSQDIVQWLKDYCVNSGLNGYCAGVSGGIDSAVISTLCAKTELPCKFYSIPIKSHEANNRTARIQLSWLTNNYSNTDNWEYNLDKTYDSFVEDCEYYGLLSNLAKANTKCRLRHVFLYAQANTHNLLLCLSGNLIEDMAIGFATKGGDLNCGDINPIGGLTKTEVYGLAKYLNIPQEVQEASPCDGLWDDPEKNDQNQIGATYPELEFAHDYIENKLTHALSKRQEEVIAIYKHFNTKNKHKMLPIPVFKVDRGKYKTHADYHIA